MIQKEVISSNQPISIKDWPPCRTLSVSRDNQPNMYTALISHSSRFFEFKYSILKDVVVFTFRADDEDYVALKLAYGI